MSTKLGHFEILSELAKSATGKSIRPMIRKAGKRCPQGDPAQRIRRKRGALEQALLAEAERTKILASPNITNVSGAI